LKDCGESTARHAVFSLCCSLLELLVGIHCLAAQDLMLCLVQY